jgi:hypothetical protein
VAHNLDRFGSQGAKYPTSCTLCSSGLIWCVYKMMQIGDRGPCLALYSPGGRVTSRFEGESSSRARLVVLYMDPDMSSFLTKY